MLKANQKRVKQMGLSTNILDKIDKMQESEAKE